MRISKKVWDGYVEALRNVNRFAAAQVEAYWMENTIETLADWQAAIEYAYWIAQEYGGAAAAAACELYDVIALESGKAVASALPAPPPTIEEVAEALRGTAKTGNPTIVGQSIGRIVKLQGVDTTMQNALRDGAEWAWVPHGTTCAFCITLASRGWQRASKKAIRNGHAEHIHPNCDCTYAVRFDSDTDVEGYDAEHYLEMYMSGAPGGNSYEKINGLRRRLYKENKEAINAQRREAYRQRKEREGDNSG